MSLSTLTVWDVAVRPRRVLRNRGATVVLSRNDNRSVGPCIDERARIASDPRADATASIHADGGPRLPRHRAGAHRERHPARPAALTVRATPQ